MNYLKTVHVLLQLDLKKIEPKIVLPYRDYSVLTVLHVFQLVEITD